ncbi:MAG: energy transducer TonB [Acidobacteriia bacterium]|nr:energy transducer TonB [Terriglobia bacterium]
MSAMAGSPESRHEEAKVHRAEVRKKVSYIGELRDLWEVVSDRDFERHYRAKYFGEYRIKRHEALGLLDRWERELLDQCEVEGLPLRLLWEVPSIQKLMWMHLKEFFVQRAPTSVPRPVTAKPVPAKDIIVREHFPGGSLVLAFAVQIALLIVLLNPLTQHAYQKLEQLNQQQSLTYFKISEYLPEVFSPNANSELPKTAKIIPKKNQTIISNPPNPDNEFQTILQPNAPKAVDLAEIKLPNIISMKPRVPEPLEPPTPTIQPGLEQALSLPKDLLIPIPPALPPKMDVGKRAISDLHIADSAVLNPEARLLLKPNAEVPDVENLPLTTFGNTYANVPMPKGPDAVPTVTPEIGRFNQVDMPDLVVLNVNPSPPGKDVKVPNVTKAASFGTEAGSGNGGGAKSGAMGIPGITVSGGGLTNPGAAVVQTDRLPSQSANNIPPRDRGGAGSRSEHGRSGGKTPELQLPKTDRFTLERSTATDTSKGSPEEELTRERTHEKKIYTAYLNLANLSSETGSWVMRFSEYEDPTLTASRKPTMGSHPGGELSAPLLIRGEHPRYPPSAAYERIEGNVILSAIIRRNGSVEVVKVDRSVDERLDQAAIEALKHWLFHPSKKNGQPVDVIAEITIPFNLKKPF